MENLTLVKTETGKKASKFLYEIKDENGNVLSQRQSNRDYVAATKNGAFYFGRVDLIGKGDHGRAVKYNNSDDSEDYKIIAYLK
jgi:hypothetical protein